MSDITNKIFSIEPEEARSSPKKPISNMIRPVLTDITEPKPELSKEDVPAFVTREVISPLIDPSQDEDYKTSSIAGWVLLGFGLTYIVGAGLYFGRPLLDSGAELFSFAGLVILLTLPLVLLFLLWRALHHLKSAQHQNARFSKAADILVSPEREAYQRSETLVSAIRLQISKLNNSLDGTVEALKDVQLSVTRETQAIDTAGLQLSSRSEDVGRNLTLQRQALESISGTFDTRMETLSSQISGTSDTLGAICNEAESKLTKASEALQIASGKMDQTVSEGSKLITEKISEIGEISRKLDETTESLTSDIQSSTKQLSETDERLIEKTQAFHDLNEATQAKISDLQQTIITGSELLANLKTESEERADSIVSYYENLSTQLKYSEDNALASQGKTARMVEANLAQMRQEFSLMESDMQSLQSQLKTLQSATQDAVLNSPPTENLSPRLKITPLDSDFPPVEPPRHVPTPRHAPIPKKSISPTPSISNDAPLNLGMDMEISNPDSEITNFEPDVIRRPGEPAPEKTSKGFGRRTANAERSGWRWRDMLGTLDRTDGALTGSQIIPLGQSINAVAILTELQLSPSAIVDEGTVIDATQARLDLGEPGIIKLVSDKLPEAVSHLRLKMSNNPDLRQQLTRFSDDFVDMIGQTPPTAPALRATLGSPDGRAYMLCAAALNG